MYSPDVNTADSDLCPSFHIDTPSPSGSVLMSEEDPTTSVSASNDTKAWKDDSGDISSLNSSQIGSTSLKKKLTRDPAIVTLSSIPKVDPNIPYNEINEV